MARGRGIAGRLAGLAAVCLVAACGPKQAAPRASDPIAAAEAKAGAMAAATSELDAAFAAAFGSPPPTVRIVERQGDPVTLRYRPLKLIEIGARVVLVSGGRGEGCHGCAGALAIAYLHRTPTGFVADGRWPEIVDGASFGEPPDWSLREDLFPAPAIEARGGGTWQGCTVEDATYVELTPDRPIVRTRPILLTYDDGGAARENEGRSVEGRVRSLRKGVDFAVDYTGSVRRSVTYRLKGGAYMPIGSFPDLPSC